MRCHQFYIQITTFETTFDMHTILLNEPSRLLSHLAFHSGESPIVPPGQSRSFAARPCPPRLYDFKKLHIKIARGGEPGDEAINNCKSVYTLDNTSVRTGYECTNRNAVCRIVVIACGPPILMRLSRLVYR